VAPELCVLQRDPTIARSERRRHKFRLWSVDLVTDSLGHWSLESGDALAQRVEWISAGGDALEIVEQA
jgi:hypothetical protein